MDSLNKVILIGYLGSTPELKTTANGAPYTSLNLAVRRRKKSSETGLWERITEWHRVTVWGRTAETVSGRLQKGAPLAIAGHLEQYKRENESGTSTVLTTIVADDVHFLSSRRGREMGAPTASP